MKTYTVTTPHNREFQASRRDPIHQFAASIREILALLSAVTTATSMILISVWVAGTDMTNIAAALIWSVGLVFFAIALDSRGPLAHFQWATGLALLISAWLQNSISPDFAILSGALLAAWAAIVLFSRLR